MCQLAFLNRLPVIPLHNSSYANNYNHLQDWFSQDLAYLLYHQWYYIMIIKKKKQENQLYPHLSQNNSQEQALNLRSLIQDHVISVLKQQQISLVQLGQSRDEDEVRSLGISTKCFFPKIGQSIQLSEDQDLYKQRLKPGLIPMAFVRRSNIKKGAVAKSKAILFYKFK